jgi:predicted outer membrane repeat protein
MIRHSSFIMNGGKISGNHASTLGGGVVLWDGSFIMNAGEISNNNAGNGGGVLINQTGTFTMNGGVIKGNTAGDTGGGIYALDRTLTQNGGGSRITVSITGGEIIGNSAKYGGGIALYNSRLTKTGGYIAGTDSGINANVSTQNQGDAILYCRDTTFWDRKLSLTQSDNISTDNMNNGWTYLGVEGSF